MQRANRLHPLIALPAAALGALWQLIKVVLALALLAGMLLLGVLLFTGLLMWAVLRGRRAPAFSTVRARTMRPGAWRASAGQPGPAGEVIDIEARELHGAAARRPS